MTFQNAEVVSTCLISRTALAALPARSVRELSWMSRLPAVPTAHTQTIQRTMVFGGACHDVVQNEVTSPKQCEFRGLGNLRVHGVKGRRPLGNQVF